MIFPLVFASRAEALLLRVLAKPLRRYRRNRGRSTTEVGRFIQTASGRLAALRNRGRKGRTLCYQTEPSCGNNPSAGAPRHPLPSARARLLSFSPMIDNNKKDSLRDTQSMDV